MDGLERIKTTRGLQAKIARELGIHTSAVAMWKKIPAKRVPEVERITGIPRHELRDDLWVKPGNPSGGSDENAEPAEAA